MEYNIFFNLNNKEKIIIKSNEYPIQELCCCDNITISMVYDDNTYILNQDWASEAMMLFKHFLQKALKGDLALHKSITQDIGFLWNERLQHKPSLVYKKIDGVNRWVGEDNLLWETPGDIYPNLETWLYNDEHGQIILKITPTYPWHFDGNPPISYQDFIRNYKPLLTRTISPSMAEIWLKTTRDILNIIEKNKHSAEKNCNKE